MNHYWIKVIAHIPVPREREFRIEANGIGTAIRRAVDEYRKEFKKRKIEEMDVKVKKL